MGMFRKAIERMGSSRSLFSVASGTGRRSHGVLFSVSGPQKSTSCLLNSNLIETPPPRSPTALATPRFYATSTVPAHTAAARRASTPSSSAKKPPCLLSGTASPTPSQPFISTASSGRQHWSRAAAIQTHCVTPARGVRRAHLVRIYALPEQDRAALVFTSAGGRARRGAARGCEKAADVT